MNSIGIWFESQCRNRDELPIVMAMSKIVKSDGFSVYRTHTSATHVYVSVCVCGIMLDEVYLGGSHTTLSSDFVKHG